jgi:hypothetical protein
MTLRLLGPNTLVLIASILAGCQGTEPFLCPAMVASYSVAVVDADTVAVTGASLTAVLDRTGRTLTPYPPVEIRPGNYVVVDDHSKTSFRSRSDQVHATVVVGPKSVTGVFAFRFNGCSVAKVSGPDTLVLP